MVRAPYPSREAEIPMSLCINIGPIDRMLRILFGLSMVAFALSFGFPATGWNQLGWLGLVPLATGITGYCPVYAIAEIDTLPRNGS